jgi:hypothetical protein
MDDRRRARNGAPRIESDSRTSVSRTDSLITTYSLNARHRSGSVTSFHFHPDRDDGEPHATTLYRQQMGAVEHFSATNNTFQRIEARDARDDRHRLVREVNDQNRHFSRHYLDARAGGDAADTHRRANPITRAALDSELDDYFAKGK